MTCNNPDCPACQLAADLSGDAEEMIAIIKAMTVAGIDGMDACSKAFVESTGNQNHPSRHAIVAIRAATLMLSGLIRAMPEGARAAIIPVVMNAIVSHVFQGSGVVAGMVEVPDSATEAEVKAAIGQAIAKAVSELGGEAPSGGLELKIPGTIH